MQVFAYLNLLGNFRFIMFTNLKQLDAMHKVALVTQRLCTPYWVGFSADNEQNPITQASFYKDFGHN